MLSTPPAATRSASPVLIRRAACAAASRPLAHSRLTVTPGTRSGSPARSTAIRATFRLSSPAWLAQPRITSSSCSPTPRALPSAHGSARGRSRTRLYPGGRPRGPVPPRRTTRQGGRSSLLPRRFHARLPAPAHALRRGAAEAGGHRGHAVGRLHRQPGEARADGEELCAELSPARRSRRQGDGVLRGAVAPRYGPALGVPHRPGRNRALPARRSAVAVLPQRRRHPAGAGAKRPSGEDRLVAAG